MDGPEQPTEATEPGAEATGCLDRGLIILTIVMPLIAAAVIGSDVAGFVGAFAPHWLAVVAGVIGFLVTLACLFAGLRDQLDFIMVPLGIIILGLMLFPVFTKAREKHQRERLRHETTVSPHSRNSATP